MTILWPGTRSSGTPIQLRGWEYESPTWAGKFLTEWCRQAMRSRIEPMKKVARMLRTHRDLILNYFKARKLFSSGIIEGLNNKVFVYRAATEAEPHVRISSQKFGLARMCPLGRNVKSEKGMQWAWGDYSEGR